MLAYDLDFVQVGAFHTQDATSIWQIDCLGPQQGRESTS